MKGGISKARHWLLVLGVRGAGGVAGVLATITASRLLGAKDAGLVLLSLSIVTVLSAFSRIGLDNALVRHIGMHAANGEWNKVQGAFRLALKWSVRTSLCTAALVCLSAGMIAEYGFHKPALAPVLQIMAWMVPATTIYVLCAQSFIGTRRPEIATFLQNIGLPLSFVLLLTLATLISLPARGEILGAAAYTLAGAATLFLALTLWSKLIPAAPPMSDAEALWKSAAPLWVVVLMSQVVSWGGQIVSGIWLGAAQVALLAAAQRTAVLISLVLMVTNMLVAPRFAALHQQGNAKDLKRLARRSTSLMTLVATIVVSAIAAAATPLMRLFGHEFIPAAALLRILVLGQWVNVASGSVGLLLQMTGHERDMRNISIFSGCLAVALAVALTSYHGVVGAAWAITLTVAIQNAAAMLMVRYRLGFFTFGLI
nr:oligosaccharide flippase family protein [Solimonas terrae]